MMFDSSKNNKSYYCVPSSNFNYACISIDEQIALHIQRVQIAPEVLPKIRRAYLADIAHYTTHQGREEKQLKTALQKVELKELNLWRGIYRAWYAGTHVSKTRSRISRGEAAN